MCKSMDPNIADIIAKECINHYQNLGKKGKPVTGIEWTLLSCVVMTLNGKNTIVSMATGTKCLGRKEMSPRGDLVNDSHAEVLARRCFLRYLYDQVLTFQRSGTSSIIVGCNSENKYEINSDIEFHFYSSHVPCGDASIIPKQKGKRKCDSTNNEVVKKKKTCVANLKDQTRYESAKNYQDEKKSYIDESVQIVSRDKLNTESLVVEMSRVIQPEHTNKQMNINQTEDKTNPSKLTENITNQRLLVDGDDGCSIADNSESYDVELGEVVDVHRTGAKCLRGEDRRLPGALYHQVGAVRTKPGRGDPTLSVSCSDKLARWVVCGLQGALLSLVLSRPVLLTSVVVGGGGPYSEDVLRRALLGRSQASHSVIFLHSSVIFPHSRYSVGLSARPCPSAILWTHVSHKPLQVCVEGRRQGATKACRENGRLVICKLELLKSFLAVAHKTEYEGMSYKALKALAEEYNRSSVEVKSALKIWTFKPSHLEEFKLDSRSGEHVN